MTPAQILAKDLATIGWHREAFPQRFIATGLFIRRTIARARSNGHWVVISEDDTHVYAVTVDPHKIQRSHDTGTATSSGLANL